MHEYTEETFYWHVEPADRTIHHLTSTLTVINDSVFMFPYISALLCPITLCVVLSLSHPFHLQAIYHAQPHPSEDPRWREGGFRCK